MKLRDSDKLTALQRQPTSMQRSYQVRGPAKNPELSGSAKEGVGSVS